MRASLIEYIFFLQICKKDTKNIIQYLFKKSIILVVKKRFIWLHGFSLVLTLGNIITAVLGRIKQPRQMTFC